MSLSNKHHSSILSFPFQFPDDEVAERDEIRRDRQKERQRDRNLARAAPDKRSRIQRERERDISEKIALNMPDARAGGSGEVQFDQRLFNQSKVYLKSPKCMNVVTNQ